MTVHNYTNTASTAQLDAPLNSSANVFQVTGLTGYPAAPFYILMDRDTSSAELMEVTQVAGVTLTATRGAGGTAATSHSAGATIEHVIPAAVPQAAEAHIEATTDVHGVAGALVGADNPGVLTSKTYRGVGRHVYSDSLPADPAAGFIVEADTSISRDGFVASGTAANTDRRGFLLTQNGADRFEARYDGTVKINPSGASSRPGLEVTTTIQTEDLVVNDDATVNGTLNVIQDFSSQTVTTANVNVSQGLAVTGTSTLGQVNAGVVSGTSVNASGAGSVGGALTVAGSGTSLILSGANARLRFPSSPTASAPGTAAGEVRYRNGGLEAYDGSTWRGQGGVVGTTDYNYNTGGIISSSTFILGSITVPSFGAGMVYKVFLSAQCEINDVTPGVRYDLFIFEQDDGTSDVDLAVAVGVGNGFTQTGLGAYTRFDGNSCTFNAVVKRTVGGAGQCNVSVFNQMFTYMAFPRHA